MNRCANLVLLFLIAMSLTLTYGNAPVDKHLDVDCLSPHTVCNDMNLVTKCKAFKFCDSVGRVCSALDFIAPGLKKHFMQIFENLFYVCHDGYKPFRKLYDPAGVVEILVRVGTGQSQFNLTLGFNGVENKNTTLASGTTILLNNQEISNGPKLNETNS